MYKKISLIIAIFAAFSVMAQPPEFDSFLSSLRNNDSYLTVCASSSVESEAQALARINLSDSVSVWAKSASPVANDIDRVMLSACCVTFEYENLFHGVAYVKKTELGVIKSSSSCDDADWNEYGYLSEDRHTIANLYIAKLLQCKTINDVYGTLSRQGSSNKLHYCGVINRKTNPKLIDNAILVIYDDGGTVRAVLSEKNPHRKNLSTGKEDATKNYAGNNALWVMFRQ